MQNIEPNTKLSSNKNQEQYKKYEENNIYFHWLLLKYAKKVQQSTPKNMW